MAQRVSFTFKESAIDAVTQAGRVRIGRAQRAEIGSNLPNTPVQELGSDKLVGRIFDIPEVTASVSLFDVGAQAAFTMAGVDWAAAASGTKIELQDIQYVGLVVPFKGQGTDDLARTLVVPAAKIDRYSLNYSVGGDATEEFSFVGTTKYWLKYDVAIATGAVTGNSITLTSARQLKNGRYYLSVYAEGIGYVPHEAITASTATSVTFDPVTVPDTTNVVVMYHADLTDQWDYTYEYADNANLPVGIRGWGVEVYLVKNGETDQKVYRVQTCTIQGQQQTNRVQELGNEEVVGYSDNIPDVTGTLEILAHDFKLTEQLSGDTTGDNWTDTEMGEGDWGLLVKLWPKGVDRSANTPVKSVFLPKLDVTQEQNSTQVGQDARVTYNFASRTNQVFIYKGDWPGDFWG